MGHVARIQESRSAFKISTDKPIENKHFGSLRHRWEDNIRVDLEEIGIITRNWVDRNYWRALVNAALNLLVT